MNAVLAFSLLGAFHSEEMNGAPFQAQKTHMRSVSNSNHTPTKVHLTSSGIRPTNYQYTLWYIQDIYKNPNHELYEYLQPNPTAVETLKLADRFPGTLTSIYKGVFAKWDEPSSWPPVESGLFDWDHAAMLSHPEPCSQRHATNMDTLTDIVLFHVFYSCIDERREAAAAELAKREWRLNTDTHIWNKQTATGLVYFDRTRMDVVQDAINTARPRTNPLFLQFQ